MLTLQVLDCSYVLLASQGVSFSEVQEGLLIGQGHYPGLVTPLVSYLD